MDEMEYLLEAFAKATKSYLKNGSYAWLSGTNWMGYNLGPSLHFITFVSDIDIFYLKAVMQIQKVGNYSEPGRRDILNKHLSLLIRLSDYWNNNGKVMKIYPETKCWES